MAWPAAFARKMLHVLDATLLDCLERNEKNGVVYHREGITGDYDDFDNAEALMEFIRTGKREPYEPAP